MTIQARLEKMGSACEDNSKLSVANPSCYLGTGVLARHTYQAHHHMPYLRGVKHRHHHIPFSKRDEGIDTILMKGLRGLILTIRMEREKETSCKVTK